jgi:hypothetical protein
LYKAYLEAFFNFCKELGGTTADVMCEILAVSNEWKDYLCWLGKSAEMDVVSVRKLQVPSYNLAL